MNPSSSSYGYLPYSSTSQVSSPGSQVHQTPQPQQQLGSVTSQQLSQELAQELSSPPPPLSLHASSLQTSPTTVVSTSPTSPLSLSPGSISNNSCNSNGPNNNNNGTSNGSGTGHPTINTAILSSFGGMLPSPQHSSQGVPSTPTAGSILPTTPPQTADLDTILATYSSQPELLKLIIASKTEEDRRWAEEARFKMMDLIMRGENRNMALMTGYEGLLAQTVTGTTTGTPVSNVSTGNMSSAGGGAHPTATTTTTTTSTALGVASNGKRFMDDGYDNSTSGTSAGSPAATTATVGNGIGLGSSSTVGGDGGSYGQGPDHGLSRKRSVTFARDMPHGHLRSQSMSSMPTASNLAGPTIPSTSSAFNSLSMMGLTGPNTALQSHHSQQHGSFQQAPPLTLQQQYQQQQHQFQQHQQLQHQAPHQQLPPTFGQYPQVFPYHGLSPLSHQQSHHHHQNVIRRTNSLSHLSHIAQSQHTTVMEPRLVAGRPRNDSATSFRTMDDSDEESDEDYSDHPVMGGMNSRPGSSLSMNNMMGGNGETSLTLHFSDLASVSGPSGLGPGSYQQQQQQVSQSSIMSSLHHGVPSVMPMNMPGMGLGTASNSGPGAGTGLRGRTGTNTSTASADGAGGADQKRKRKRREMQPVNKIVESPEPHVDQYLWKNNGNTTQKKTGCKSIYYKCSNSAGGCTVNKTVTEKEGGGYVTKYRGEHLEECIKIRRAQLAAQAAQAAQNAYSLQKE